MSKTKTTSASRQRCAVPPAGFKGIKVMELLFRSEFALSGSGGLGKQAKYHDMQIFAFAPVPNPNASA